MWIDDYVAYPSKTEQKATLSLVNEMYGNRSLRSLFPYIGRRGLRPLMCSDSLAPLATSHIYGVGDSASLRLTCPPVQAFGLPAQASSPTLAPVSCNCGHLIIIREGGRRNEYKNKMGN